MAAFDAEADLSADVGFRLLSNTPVTLFWRMPVLDRTTGWLRDHGYQVTHLDASGWTTEEAMHRDVAAVLAFPGYYGHNLDALNDWGSSRSGPYPRPGTTRSGRTPTADRTSPERPARSAAGVGGWSWPYGEHLTGSVRAGRSRSAVRHLPGGWTPAEAYRSPSSPCSSWRFRTP
ncbi:hypothetical protein MicB006_4014 [Micromonospora sp. B006]|nr:hypothetical protein MicB006_4014 [Micromonospora sp. B006]